nr:hypothetical protein [Tanacetum cinerariifolium]
MDAPDQLFVGKSIILGGDFRRTKPVKRDRTLKDIMDAPDQLFVGKSIILGGDFRRTKPVKRGMLGVTSEVHNCLFGCDNKYNELNEQNGEYFIQVQAYKNSLKTLEKQKKVLQRNQLTLEDKIRVLSIELKNTSNLLKHSERINADVETAKKDLQTKLDNHLVQTEKWRNSSKNLFRLIDSSMSVRIKVGLGFNNCIRENKFGWDDSAFSVFTTNSKDVEGRPLFHRFAKADSMKAVPLPLSGDYTSLSDHSDLDESQMSYGTKSLTSSDSKSVSNDFVSCNNSDKSSEVNTNDFAFSDSSVKSSEPKPNDSTSCASTSSVSTSENEAEIESNVETPIQEPIIVQDLPSFSCNNSDKNENTSRTSCNKNGYFNKKAGHFRKHASSVSKLCFVCGSGTHLIKDCDFYEKQMPNKTVGIGVGLVHSRNMVNHQIPTGKPKVFAPVHAGRQNRPFPVPIDRGYSPSVSSGWRKVLLDLCLILVDLQENPFSDAEVEGIFDSGCSRSMTGNKERLDDFQAFQGGKVTFGGGEDTECLVLSKDFKLPDERMVEDGSCDYKNMNRLVKGNLVRGLPSKLFKNDHTCVACCKGKQHKASYKAINAVSSIFKPLQLLHMDLFGLTSIKSTNHKYYCLVITDDYSRFCWVFFLEHKDATYSILRDFINLVENQLNKNLKAIKCDNGTEFKNAHMIELCGSKGIKMEYSNARTPQQNRVAERKNRTLIEAARTILADSKLPTMFWTEAVRTACYVLNRVLVLLGKFDGKADEGYIIRYSASNKAYRVYNVPNKRVEETMNLRFLEEKPNYFDLDYLTDTFGYKHVQANQSAGTQEATTNLAGTQDADSDSDCDEQVIIVPSYPIFQKELARLKGQEQKATFDAESLGLGSANDAEELQKNAGAKTVPPGSIPVPTGYIPVPASPTMVSTNDVLVHTSSSTDSFFDDEPTTRFPCPSYLGNHDPLPGIFSFSSYDDEFGNALNNVASTVEVSPVATTRINIIHPQSLIIGDHTLAVQTRSKVKQTTTVPTGASSVPSGSPSVPVDVPPSVAPAGVSNKGKYPMVEEDIPVKARIFKQMQEDILGEQAAKRLHDEEQAELDRQRAELQRRRQQETLLGDDVSEDNFPARLTALIKRKKQALAEKLATERRNRPMTQAQQRAYMRQYGDLQVLFDSHEEGKGSWVWQHQHLWEIRSWRLYTLFNVYILETVSGEVLSMFTDISYPLSIKLMEKMLRHKLQIDKDVVGNDMTTAEQFIQLIKN